MSKLIIPFDIPYLLQEKRRSPGRYQINQIGELKLQGSFEQRHGEIVAVNIDFVLLNGIDIMPVMLHWELLKELEIHCLANASSFITKQVQEVAA